MAHPSRAFLNEIVTTVPITSAQSAAIVAMVASRLDRWIAAKNPDQVIVPALADLAVHREGHLWWFRGRSVDASAVVPVLGLLLDGLLQMDAGRVPAGLLYIVARATDARHLAPFESLAEFAAAVARHAPEQKEVAVDALLARYLVRVSGMAPLGHISTISDVRRLRRAGGVTLPRIAEDTGIPLSLLRELEWGVFVHWDPWHTSRSLEAYAERAGLDPSRVTEIVRREVTQELPVPVRVPVRAHSGLFALPAGVLSRARLAALPYALGAILLAAVAALAPHDQVESFPSARAATAGTAQPVSLVRPVSDESPGRTIEPPPERNSPQPRRRVRTGVAKPVTAAPRRERRGSPPPRGLARLARAITGDGKHKVEPFPRVQN